MHKLTLYKTLLIFLFFFTYANAEISYREILDNPTDLKLNLDYAKQQETSGNYKLTIATLERLNMLYPSNSEIKIYLLSILVKMDSSAKVEIMVQRLLNDPNTTQETKDLIAELLSNTGIQKQKSKWFAYLDLSYSQTEEDNVDAISKTETLWAKDSKLDYATDAMKYDKSYSRSGSLTLGKNIDNTSSLYFNLGLSVNTQNKAVSDENDLGSGSITYFKVLGDHYISPYVYYSRPNYRRAKDSNTKGVGINNTYLINEKNSLNYGMGYSKLRNNRNDNFSTANESNNETYSSNIRYNYNFSKKNQLGTKISYSEIKGNKDINSYDSSGLTLSYSHILPFGTFILQSSYSENVYEEKDTFINSTINRKDKPFVNSLSLTGQLNQILPFAKIINKDNTIFYNINFKHSDVSSNVLNYDTEREFLTFKLTKRLNFND